MNLVTLKKPGRMVLLCVRTFDLRKHPAQEGEFDRAWYRLNNEETNQSVDYKKIRDIEKPEGFEEDAQGEEDPETGEQPLRNELVYIAGRLFFDTNERWVYESYNHCFTSEKYPDIAMTLGQLYEKSESEVAYQTETMKSVKDKVAA